MRKLAPKRRLFVAEYVKDFNATQAAIRAGYSEKTAKSQGQRLLTFVDVQAALAVHKRGLENRLADIDLSAERILREISLRAYANMDDFTEEVSGERRLRLSGLSREQMAAVQELTEDHTGGTGDGERKLILRTRIRLADQLRALEMLARYKALFNDKLNVESTTLDELADRITEGLKRLRQARGAPEGR